MTHLTLIKKKNLSVLCRYIVHLVIPTWPKEVSLYFISHQKSWASNSLLSKFCTLILLLVMSYTWIKYIYLPVDSNDHIELLILANGFKLFYKPPPFFLFFYYSKYCYIIQDVPNPPGFFGTPCIFVQNSFFTITNVVKNIIRLCIHTKKYIDNI